MPISGSLVEQLSERLSRYVGRSVDVEREVPVGGGSINDAYRLHTNEGRFFVKVNPGSRPGLDRYPSMFEAEADGLRRLRETGSIRVPEVIAFGEDHDDSYLLLEHIDAGMRTNNFWNGFGRSLARMHARTRDHFGLERSNYIGSLKQANDPHDTWEAFFIHCRCIALRTFVCEARRALPQGTAGVVARRSVERQFSLRP
jgi:protein-ribulosamine 3-kinase